MKEMKAPEKVAQKMTHDGAVVENLVTGEVDRISHRESEADFSAPEKEISFGSPLEQAAHAHARHQEHKVAKENADSVREGSGARNRPSSRLQFSEEELADPALQKYIRRSDRAADKLDDAKEKIPTKTIKVKERVFDEATGKGKTSIRFEKAEAKPNGKLRQNPLSRPVQEITHAAHNEVRKVEQENVGVEKYIGYPYVWGGSNPSTFFDCSGFVSWALTNSGVCNVGRLSAQGLYNISTPVPTSNAQPGDLIFFKGTYDTPGISHVGIYAGGGMMLHCGDPIRYVTINTSYWQSHFYTFARPPYNH